MADRIKSVRLGETKKRKSLVSSFKKRTWRHTTTHDKSTDRKKEYTYCGFYRIQPVLPPIVEQCCSYLEHHAIQQEGLFRVPGSSQEIKIYKKQFDKGKKVDLEKINNVHTVAGILKLFFTQLPNSILTFELFPSFMNACGKLYFI
eukprot:TRINITY_DN107_c0_g2_i1.p1 TRINITY_DN107_c0_g2~~TRINITY_DN107_c0_g2_i1.p1  ORF type:complete len:154 (-),score=36.56 TRINITY_DN107_c0_g2_i1:31-468(-)